MAAASTALLPRTTADAVPHPIAAPVVPEVRGLLEPRSYRIVIVVSALVYGSHALYDAFAVIHWSSAGLDPWVISVLWAEAVGAEVAVFFLVGPALIDRIGARGAAVLAAVAGLVRWSLMGLSSSVVLLSLPLHGLTFALLHLACMRVLAHVVPR